MRHRWLNRRRTRLLAGLLLLPALACRVAVPPGFMPGTGPGHAPTVQMCHGAGPLPASAATDSPAGGQAPVRGTHHEPPCVFAAAGTAAPPPVLALLASALQSPVTVPVAPAHVVVPRAVHRAQSARAPPPGSAAIS